ncbi:MAG: diguanylate cyclase [Chloroflexota bacterium]|nr:sensor domain-containing diguanylate cyclase [Anaerolineales bacterium]
MPKATPFEVQLRRLERIQAINYELVAKRSLGEILHQIVRIAAEVTECEIISLLLLDEASNTLRFVVTTRKEDRLFNFPVPQESIAGAAFAGDEPVIVHDVQSDPRYFPDIAEVTNYLTYTLIALPLKFRERKIGVLEAGNKRDGQLFDETDVQLLTTIAAQATIAIENARLYQKAQDEIAERIRVEEQLRRHRDDLDELVKERTAEVHRLAITDALTNLFNRYHLIELGNQALFLAQRHHSPLAALMLDIDHFKMINDTYGHAAGDEALRKLADQLRQGLRSSDILGRYGGDEFVVLMPETDLQTARQSAERLLAGIRELRVSTPQTELGFTASIGVAELDHARQQTIDALIACADNAMYAAKQAGRDRVVTQ